MSSSINIRINFFFTIILSTITAIPVSILATEKPIKPSSGAQYRKISIQGNIEVTMVQRKSEGVYYADDNTGSAKVVRNSGMLTITGTSKAPSKLFIYVNDLYRIEATDNAVVRTEGKLNTKFLQIFLKGDARADIQINTQGVYTAISDNANLKLSGSTNDHIQAAAKKQKLNTNDLVVLKASNISRLLIIY